MQELATKKDLLKVAYYLSILKVQNEFKKNNIPLLTKEQQKELQPKIMKSLNELNKDQLTAYCRNLEYLLGD